MNKHRKRKNKKTDSISSKSKKIGKEKTLWRSTLQKINNLRKNGLQVIMKSYIQVLRSHIDPSFLSKDATPEEDEFEKKITQFKVQVTNKRQLTLRLTPTN